MGIDNSISVSYQFIDEMPLPVAVFKTDFRVIHANLAFQKKHFNGHSTHNFAAILEDIGIKNEVQNTISELYADSKLHENKSIGTFSLHKLGLDAFMLVDKLASPLELPHHHEEMEKIRRKLNHHELQFELLFSNMRETMALYKVITDSNCNPVDFEYVAVNKAFEEIIGLKNSYLKGKRLFEEFPNTEEYWKELHKLAYQHQQTFSHQAFSSETKRYWELKVFPAGPGRIASTANDITERIEHDEALRQKNQILKSTEERLLAYNEQLRYTCESIKENELRYKSLFDNSNDAIIIISNQSICECNKRALELFECQHNALIGQLFAFISPEIQPGGLNSAMEMSRLFSDKSDNSIQTLNWRFVKPNGKIIDTRLKLRWYSHAQTDYWYALVQDLTIEKKQLNQIEEKQYLLEQAQQMARLGYWSFELKNPQKIIWSSQMFSIFESVEPAGFHQIIERFVHPDDKECLEQHYKNFIEKHQPLYIQFRILTHTGKTKYILQKGEVFYNDNKYLGRGIIQDVTENKQQENELAQSENRFQSILMDLPVLLCANDHTGRFVFWNHEAENVTGFSQSEMLNRPDAHMLLSHGHEFFDLLQQTDRENFTHRETLLNCKNGQQKVILWAGYSKKYPIRGWHTWMAGIDITTRKYQEEEIMEQKQFLDILIDNLPLMVFTKSLPDYKYSLVNKNFERLTGYKKDEIIGRTDSEIDPEHADWSIQFDNEVFNSDTAITKSIEYKHVNRIISTIKVPVKHKNQKPYLLGISQDITEQYQQEKRILLESQLNQSLANASSELISPTVSIETIARTIFSACLELTQSQTGYVAFNDPMSENILVHYFSDSIQNGHILGGNLHFFPKAEYFQKGLFGHPIDCTQPVLKNNINLTGQKRIGNLNPAKITSYLTYPAIANNQLMGQIVLINAPNGFSDQQYSFIKSLSNVYGLAVFRKRMEWDLVAAKEKAEESDRLKSAFLANMSHEIRTPMNAIMGFSQMLTSSRVDDARKEEFSNLINSSCEDLLMLVNDIIDISKIQAGQLRLYPAPFKLHGILHEVLEMASSKPMMLEKKLELVLDNPTDFDLLITSDKGRLKQVMMNLLGNAIKFTEQGTINFGYEWSRNQYISFYVKDTGIGIPYDMQQQIFESFRQVEPALERNYRGTGLGLSISKHIIEQLGGEIGVESIPGKGSKFWFTLPFKLDEDSVDIIADSQVENLNLHQKKILIVEDDPKNSRLLEIMLLPTNAEISFAYDGLEAIELVNNIVPDLVLMDIRLPRLDGLEATRQIRKRHPNLPIIAQTAYAMKEDMAKCFDAGCNAYISKPVNHAELINTIDGIFRSM